jgi:hypothetical protein
MFSPLIRIQVSQYLQEDFALVLDARNGCAPEKWTKDAEDLWIRSPCLQKLYWVFDGIRWTKDAANSLKGFKAGS